MAAEPGEYVTHEAVVLGVTAHAMLEGGKDFLVAFHQLLHLCRDEEAETTRGYYMFQCWQERGEDRVEVIYVFGLGGDELVNDHVPPSCFGGREESDRKERRWCEERGETVQGGRKVVERRGDGARKEGRQCKERGEMV